MKTKSVSDRVYAIVSAIPYGKVLTYGKVAEHAGIKNPRLIGSILHHNIDPLHIPCHRVVNAQGRVAKSYAFGGIREHIKKLEEEGIKIYKERVDLKKYMWKI
jgi:methylated-DNA-protein-cysteine methyltransferase-like protein